MFMPRIGKMVLPPSLALSISITNSRRESGAPELAGWQTYVCQVVAKITQSQPKEGERDTFSEIIDGYLRLGLPTVKGETTRTEYRRQAPKLRER